MLALGAAIGKLTASNNANAILLSGIRHPTKFELFDNNPFIELNFFFFRINVRGPGQNNLISCLSKLEISKLFFTSCKFLTGSV